MRGYTIAKTAQPSETDKAYIAGFVDGEGTVVIGRRFDVQVTIGQVDPRPLERIASFYGGHLSFVHRDNPNWKPYHRITVSGTAAVQMLRDIQPFLVLKGDQAELALRLMSIKRVQSPGGHRKVLSWQERAERESFRLALIELRATA